MKPDIPPSGVFGGTHGNHDANCTCDTCWNAYKTRVYERLAEQIAISERKARLHTEAEITLSIPEPIAERSPHAPRARVTKYPVRFGKGFGPSPKKSNP